MSEHAGASRSAGAEPLRRVRLSRREASALLRVVRSGILVYGLLTAGAVLAVVFGLEQSNWIVLAIGAFFLLRTVPALLGLMRARRTLQRGELPEGYSLPDRDRP